MWNSKNRFCLHISILNTHRIFPYSLKIWSWSRKMFERYTYIKRICKNFKLCLISSQNLKRVFLVTLLSASVSKSSANGLNLFTWKFHTIYLDTNISNLMIEGIIFLIIKSPHWIVNFFKNNAFFGKLPFWQKSKFWIWLLSVFFYF